jgi:RHS repeat-associated protein
MKSYKTSLIIISILLFQLVLAFQSSAQCVHSINPSSASIPALGGCDYIYLTTEECEYYDAYTYDEWYYVWADYYEEIVTVYADPNHEGYRQGTLIIDNYNSESDFEVPVSQEYGCEQLPSPGEITGPNIVCRGGNANFSINAIEGASFYHWAVDGNSVYNAYDTIATVLFPTYGTTVTLTAAGYNDCGEGIQSSMQVTLHYAPEPGIIGTSQTIDFNTAPAALTNIQTASDTLGKCNYQWQYSSTGTSEWVNIEGATDSTFSPGILQSIIYYRRAASDNCGTAYTNSVKITVTLSEITYLSEEEIPNPETRQLNTSLKLGYTSGNLSTTPLGGFSYSIPISCSPGTNGVQPAISLQYNSQGGNGLIGWGWHIEGLSSISRISKPYYVNSEIIPISMVTSDEYAIDGNRLVLISGTGDQGTNGSEYNTENETFSNITAQGSSGNSGPEWFKVDNKDGSVLEYGNNINAYLESPNHSRLSWFITKYTDVNGNFVKYNYSIDPVMGQVFLHSILYTGNDSVDLEPYNEIIFQYKKRADSITYYHKGVPIKNNILISKILVANEGVLVRSYEFKYKFDLYSYLVEVKESTKEGDAYNSTIFNYYDPPQVESDSSLFTLLYGQNSYHLGDINRDGLQDVYIIPKDTITSPYHNKIMMLINQSGSFVQTDEIDITEAVYKIDDNVIRLSAFGGANTIDFNGDGLMDIFYKESVDNNRTHEWPDPYPDRFQNVFRFYVSTGDGFEPLEYQMGGNNYAGEERRSTSISIYCQDFTGDGLADRIYTWPLNGQTEFYIYEAELVNGEIQYTSRSHFYYDYQIIDFLHYDYDGDGKLDLCIKTSNSVKAYKYYPNLATCIFSKDIPRSNLRIGDINGDGKTDLLSFGSPDYDVLYVSFQSDFEILENFVPHNPAIGYVNKNYFLADMNGDGKDDIIEVFNCIETYYDEYYEEYYNVYSIQCFVNYFNGNSFTSEQIDLSCLQNTQAMLSVDEENFYFSDFNGDGQKELIYDGQNVVGWNQPFIFTIRPYDKSRLLSIIKDGINNSIEVTYDALSQGILYSKTQGDLNYPLLKADLPIYVVKYTKKYGNGETTPFNNTSFSYEDLLYHPHGKGLLGFLKLTSIDSISSTKTEIINDYDSTYFKIYQSQVKTYINNTLLSEKIVSPPIFHSYENGVRHFSYVPNTLFKNKLNNSASGLKISIDTLGNLSKKLTYFLSQNGDTVKKVLDTYSNFDSFGNHQNASVTSTRGQESITRSGSFEYNSNTGLLTKHTRFFGSSPSIETSYTYDDFGNILSETTLCDGISRSIGMQYESGKARFLKSVTNPLNHTIYYDTDPALGLTLKDSTYTGLVTSYEYDDFGNLLATHYPEGYTINKSRHWSLDEEDVGETYSETVTAQNKPTSVSYFDYAGRVKRTKTQSFDGSYLVSDKVYDSKGRLYRDYLPYFEGTSADQYIQYSYDSYNRISSEVRIPSNITKTYTYYDSDLKVKISQGGKDYYKENDPSGLLYKSTDPGGTITYSYNAEDKIKTIVSPSGTTTIDYDSYGFQDKLHDLDAGTIDYNYNGLGELISQEDNNGNLVTNQYDAIGRIVQKSYQGGATTTYSYDPVNELLTRISSPGGTRVYSYDNFMRPASRTDSIEGAQYTASYSYNSKGDIDTIIYNSAVTVVNNYNEYGYPDEVRVNNQSIWAANSMNKYGAINNYTLGNQSVTSIVHDSYGFPDSILTVRNGSYLQRWNYDFNPSTGNLTSRKGLTSPGGFVEENFTYDNLDRITSYSNVLDTINISYDSGGSGNITEKTDVGEYNYTGGLHNVSSILNPTEFMQSLPVHHAEYSEFNKLEYLYDSLNTGEERKLYLNYGTDEQRVKTVYTVDNDTIKTKFFALGSYEKEIDQNNNVKELYYISGPSGIVAVLQRSNSQDSIFYVYTDHLGSWDVVTDLNGAIRDRYNFDAWGRRRNPSDWSYNTDTLSYFFDRGYTGHQNLDRFSLINMNGRIYDPVLATFLSPDNYIQAPDLTLNFNRYTYCLNNPFKYTDPDGEWIQYLIGAALSAITYTIDIGFSNGGFNNWSWDQFGKTTLFGAFSGGMGSSTGSFVGNSTQVLGALPGALVGSLSGAAVGIANSVIMHGLNNLATGNNFFKDWERSAINGLITGGVLGGLAGGMQGYLNAKYSGANPWTGKGYVGVPRTYCFSGGWYPDQLKQPDENKHCYGYVAAFTNPYDHNPENYIKYTMGNADGADMYMLGRTYGARITRFKRFSSITDYDELGRLFDNGFSMFSTTDKHVVAITQFTVSDKMRLFGGGTRTIFSNTLVMDPLVGRIIFGNQYFSNNSIITWIKW